MEETREMRDKIPIPPALETSAARVPLEVPSMGALRMMGACACGNQVLSLLRAWEDIVAMTVI